MAKKLTGKAVSELCGIEYIDVKSGVYTARRSYFYRFGMTANIWSDRVDEALTKAGIQHKILECGDQWKPFRGGDSVAKGSHFWVKFNIIDGDE